MSKDATLDRALLGSPIGPDTVTTVPPATMDAFRDHGRVQVTLGTDAEAAHAALENAAALGLDLHAMTEQLQADALKAFTSSFDQLLATLAEKRRQITSTARRRPQNEVRHAGPVVHRRRQA